MVTTPRRDWETTCQDVNRLLLIKYQLIILNHMKSLIGEEMSRDIQSRDIGFRHEF